MEDPEEASISGSSSIGEAVSGRGENVNYDGGDEDDDLYYIPERRPSLDLGPSPMDISNWHHVAHAPLPPMSYRSMTSEENVDDMEDEDEEGSSTRVQLNRSDSFSSCYSFDSDDCEKKTPKEKNKDDAVPELTDTPELMTDPNEIRHPSLTVKFTFEAISCTLKKLSEGDLQKFKTMLWKRYPRSFSSSPQGMDIVALVDRLLECYSLEVSLQITTTLLEKLERKKLVDYLQTLRIRNEVRHDLCETLKRKYSEVCEDFTMQGQKKHLDDVFVDLLITTTSDNGPNIEHEVLTIEKLDSNRQPGTPLSTKDILSIESMEETSLKFILITGAAGSGKSVAIKRLILDWIEKQSHQHVSFLFPLPFRELKHFEGQRVSLLEIIQTVYPETKKLREEDYKSDDCKMMFIFDGLDEYNGNLDFQNIELLCDHTDPSTLNIIVVNLLRQRLLYRGLFIVTSRPQGKRCIPWDAHYDEIEVRGFRDSEKDKYFTQRFPDPAQAARVIEYINSVRTFRIMCHLPLFCSVVANECQRIFTEQGTQAELPSSITYMYTKLLLVLTRQHRMRRAQELEPEHERDFLMKLGKLAFTMLEQGQFKITKSDWKEFGVSDQEAVVNSGLCTVFVTKPFVLFNEIVISFIHPTMQEYLAALYVFLSFRNQGKNIFEQQLKHKVKGMLKGLKVMEMYRSAVDRSMQYDDGKLDIFLRFLFGMTTKTNLELLQTFCTTTVKWPTVTKDAAALIRKKMSENQHPGRTSNLQRCLEELGLSASEAASR
ncbi:NLR family CARD domain-containing protein 3 [Halichoeres trimaculatus]|uniref:NLR family CARD domain-containing protein 3 n=1 Tax=Halichoeres trimaculatus TaxID=147232 RepID=UPI003D9E0BE5